MTPSTDRALSPPVKYLLYGVLGVVGLIVALRVLVFGLSLAFGLLAALVSLVVTAAVLLGIGYVAYWAISALLGSDDEVDSADVTYSTSQIDSGARTTAPEDPVERLRERYANGELTDAEFERKVEQALEGPGYGERTDRNTDLESEVN